MSNGNLRLPFVKYINHNPEISVNTVLTVHMDADWPTPSWAHEKTDIKYDEDAKSVTINYLGDRRPGVALQVLKSFSVNFELKFPSKGIWKIIVKGKAENWESKVNVV